MKKLFIFIGCLVCLAVSFTVFSETIIDGVQKLQDAILTSPDIDGGTIDNTVIGGTTAKNTQRLIVQVDCANDATTLTANQCSDTLITNYGWDGVDDQTLTLPECDTSAGAGLKFTLLVAVTDAAQDLYIDTEGATTNIYLDGTAIGDGFRVWTDNPTQGEQIVFYTVSFDGGSTYDWIANTIVGVWPNKGS